MFLIEDNSKAILYTGDIRAEPWWVNSIVRQPILVPYTHGLRRLDKIYLDTTFAVNSDPYRSFPTKAQGLGELLREIHVDDYKLRLYSSLEASPGSVSGSTEGAALCGFKFGNRTQDGCLTTDDLVILHSCEHGTKCKTLETSNNIIWITPLINRSAKGDIPELGAGGGGGDLIQTHMLELTDPQAGLKLIELCKHQIPDDKNLTRTLHLVKDVLCSGKKTVTLSLLDTSLDKEDIPLESLIHLLTEAATRNDRPQKRTDSITRPLNRLYQRRDPSAVEGEAENARRVVRHSSYTELCHLLSIFRPMDVYPCVTDEDSWNPEISIESLFSHLCTGTSFSHDQQMRLIYGVDTVSHLENSPRQSSCARAHNGTPKSEPPKSRENSGLLLGQSASGQSSPAITRASSEELGSATPKKRRVTTCISTSSSCRVKLEMSSQGRFEEQIEGVLARSFSGWLDPMGKESTSKELTMFDSTGKKSRNITKRESTAPPRPTRSGSDGGEHNRSPFSWSDGLSRQSNLLDEGHQIFMRNHHAPSVHSSHDKRNSFKRNAQILGSGTQCDPVALSDTSGSEMDAEEGDRRQMHRCIDDSYDCRSRSGTPLSLADSLFESQDLCPSEMYSTMSTDPRRMQYRKEIYQAVKSDDGYIWGREYSLASTAVSHEHDDLEL
ncbi:MAG: hypothetical protein Q9213_004457 [Squamulea squamosa]